MWGSLWFISFVEDLVLSPLFMRVFACVCACMCTGGEHVCRSIWESITAKTNERKEGKEIKDERNKEKDRQTDRKKKERKK